MPSQINGQKVNSQRYEFGFKGSTVTILAAKEGFFGRGRFWTCSGQRCDQTCR